MTDIAAASAGALWPDARADLAVAVAVAARATPAPWRLLLRRPTFLVGAAVIVFWIVCAIFGHAIAPYNPLAQQLLSARTPRRPGRTGSAPTRSAGTCCPGSSSAPGTS